MITNIKAVAAHLEQAVQGFADIAVVGISGGVDSSVVASVCVQALGKANVHLISMPYDHVDIGTFNARSAELAKKIGGIHHIVSIGDSCSAIERELEKALGPAKLDILTYANVRPRVRMNVLYSFSGELSIRHKKRARVMGTGHLSEDLIGYDTKGGDALADIFILSDLVKSEVYQLAKHYGVPQSIQDAEPSAGLYRGQTDFQELGFSYDELEPATLALFRALKRGLDVPELNSKLSEFNGLEERHVQFVLSRFKTHFHKHRAPQTIDIRRSQWFDR